MMLYSDLEAMVKTLAAQLYEQEEKNEMLHDEIVATDAEKERLETELLGYKEVANKLHDALIIAIQKLGSYGKHDDIDRIVQAAGLEYLNTINDEK